MDQSPHTISFNRMLTIIVDAQLACLLIVLVGIGIAVWQAEAPALAKPTFTEITSPYQKTLSPATGLEAPALLADAVIWHPAEQDVLIYYPLDKGQSITYTWVQGVPRQWEIVPVIGYNSYHLIWHNYAGELWRSQINSNGEQILAALEIDTNTVLSYVAVPLSNGQTLIAWHTVQNVLQPVKLLLLDPFGRPLRNIQTLLPDAEQFALTVDDDGLSHLVWILGRQLHYATASFDPELEIVVNTPETWSLELSTGTWIDWLHIHSDSNGLRSLWGIINIQNPERTHIQGLHLPQGTPFAWPKDPPMRWVGRVVGDTDSLTITVREHSKWQPALVDLDGNYQLLSSTSADASAPQVWVDPSGFYTAAWGRISEDGSIENYIHSTDSALEQITVIEETPEKLTVPVMILAGILSIPYGVLWLWLPALLLGLHSIQRSLQMGLAIGLYWGGKLLFPNPALFNDAPPELVGLLLLAISIVAYGIAFQIKRSWQMALLTFMMSDMVMTCLIFGAELR